MVRTEEKQKCLLCSAFVSDLELLLKSLFFFLFVQFQQNRHPAVRVLREALRETADGRGGDLRLRCGVMNPRPGRQTEHMHTTIWHFNIWTHVNKISRIQRVYRAAKHYKEHRLSHTPSLATSAPPSCWGGLNEEAQQEGAGHFKKLFQMFWRSIFILQF